MILFVLLSYCLYIWEYQNEYKSQHLIEKKDNYFYPTPWATLPIKWIRFGIEFLRRGGGCLFSIYNSHSNILHICLGQKKSAPILISMKIM